jgi:hypothetical protein
MAKSFPLNPPYDPTVVRFRPTVAIDFNGDPPSGGPVRSSDNLIATYEGDTNNGYFLFSKVDIYRVRQLLIDPGDASSWELKIVHDVLRGRGTTTTTLTTSADEGAGVQRVSLDLLLLPMDALLLTTSGVTATAPVAEMMGRPLQAGE